MSCAPSSIKSFFFASGFWEKAMCGLFSLLLMSCYSDKTYRYLDPESIYVFSKGDTLLYRYNSACDTFVVVYFEHYMDVRDKTHHFETVRVGCDLINFYTELNNPRFEIYRSEGIADNVYFDKKYRIFLAEEYLEYYTLGSRQIKDVYRFNTPSTNEVLKSFYYCHKYGLIAYTLHNNKTFVLDENLIIEKKTH